MIERRQVRALRALSALLLGAPLLLGARGCEGRPPGQHPVADAGPVAECFVGGCSSQHCGDAPGQASTCEWREEYACYRDARCERQADGACGWTPTPELTACLADPTPEPPPPPPGDCFVGGCSSQLCGDSPGQVSTCEWREEYACYRDASCERQADGACGWTPTAELTACLADPTPDPEPPPPAADCYVGGCSSQLCSDTPGQISTCEWTEAYACYRTASCERQSDGACGWTLTPELRMCLSAAGT